MFNLLMWFCTWLFLSIIIGLVIAYPLCMVNLSHHISQFWTDVIGCAILLIALIISGIIVYKLIKKERDGIQKV